MIGFSVSTIVSQLYVFPTIKVTYSRQLNGNYELSIGWICWELTMAF